MILTSMFLVLSGIGIINTLYLAYHAITKTDVACIGFPKEWCQRVQYSPHSKTFGIPNAYAGLVMYLIIFVLTLLYRVGTVPLWPIGVVVTIGFLFSLYFMYLQAAVIKAFCTWCVISAVDFTLLFLVLLLILRR
ncbi:MAG: vitamin K epoxide reductase family protein [Candidatus Andersenbacteria bacterium]